MLQKTKKAKKNSFRFVSSTPVPFLHSLPFLLQLYRTRKTITIHNDTPLHQVSDFFTPLKLKQQEKKRPPNLNKCGRQYSPVAGVPTIIERQRTHQLNTIDPCHSLFLFHSEAIKRKRTTKNVEFCRLHRKGISFQNKKSL